MLEVAQVEEKYEHFEEWLNIFSWEAEKTATLKLAKVEEEEEKNNMNFANLWE